MKQSVLKICSWIVAMLATTAVHAYDFQVDGVYYKGNATAKTASVTKGDDLYSGTVTIPATVTNGGVTYNVTAIEANAFANSIHLTGVNIGSNVTTIGYRAFQNCEELASVVIPDGSPFHSYTNLGKNNGVENDEVITSELLQLTEN